MPLFIQTLIIVYHKFYVFSQLNERLTNSTLEIFYCLLFNNKQQTASSIQVNHIIQVNMRSGSGQELKYFWTLIHFLRIYQIIILVKMSNLHLRPKYMVTSGINAPDLQCFQDNRHRNPTNNASQDDKYAMHHKAHMQSLGQNHHIDLKSPLVYLSQTVQTNIPTFYPEKMFHHGGENKRITQNSLNLITSKKQILNARPPLKKQAYHMQNLTSPIRSRVKSFRGQSESFNQQAHQRKNETQNEADSNTRGILQENYYRSHHVSPKNFPIMNQNLQKVQLHRSINPNQLLKNKNFDFLKTIKLKKQLKNSYQHLYKTEKSIKASSKQGYDQATVFKENIKRPIFATVHSNYQSHNIKPTSLCFIQDRNDQFSVLQDKNSNKTQRKPKIEDFQLLEKLGKGTLGDVFKAREKSIGLICVVKKMSKKKIKQLKLQEMIIRQIKLQSYLCHSHCTNIFGYFHDEDYIYLILELLPDASLQQVKKKRKLPEDQAIFIIHQVAEGLKYLHSQNIIHRDLKPQNIFMYEDYIKIGDFGCSIYHNQDGLRNSVVGSLEYLSPEQLFSEGYTQKIDSWSLGILTYQLLYGKSPFQREIKQILKGEEKEWLSQINFPQTPIVRAEAKNFINALLKHHPEQRMNMSQALAHPFLSEIEKQ